MPASRFPQRRRAAQRRASPPQDRPYTDLSGRRTLLRDELARIDVILERLRDRRRIAPDMSSEDLFELFREERDRLVTQLRAVDATLAAESGPESNRQQARVIEFRRDARAVPDAPDLS